MDRTTRRQFRCLLRQHLFQPQIAQQDFENDSGTLPAEKRNLPSYTEITYKTKKAPPGAKKNLDSE